MSNLPSCRFVICRLEELTGVALMQESLQQDVRNVQKEAEAELAQSAEQDRGAQAASSMQRDLRTRDGPDPLEDLHAQVKTLPLTPGMSSAQTSMCWRNAYSSRHPASSWIG